MMIHTTAAAAEQNVRRNLEYIEKNGVPVTLITPAMFQSDEVEEEYYSDLIMPFSLDLPMTTTEAAIMEEVPMVCEIFRNASEFVQSQGIVLMDDDCIGWLDEGDWLAYEISLNATTNTTIYNVTLSVTSPLGDGNFRVENYETQEIYATVDSFPLTEDWNTYSSVTASLDLVNVTDLANFTLVIRSLEAGWTYRDFCLQPIVVGSNHTTIPPTEAVPTIMPVVAPVPTIMPVALPLPTVAPVAVPVPTLAPTLLQATETVVPTVMPSVVASEMPTELATSVPAEEAASLAPTTAVVSEMPSSEPSIVLEIETTESIVPTFTPTASHTTLAPSQTYSPSVSDYPSTVPYSLEGVHKKSSKKSKRRGKGKGSSNSGKGNSSNSGKGGASSGKGNSSNSGKGGSSSGKGSSGLGKGSTRPESGKGSRI